MTLSKEKQKIINEKKIIKLKRKHDLENKKVLNDLKQDLINVFIKAKEEKKKYVCLNDLYNVITESKEYNELTKSEKKYYCKLTLIWFIDEIADFDMLYSEYRSYRTIRENGKNKYVAHSYVLYK